MRVAAFHAGRKLGVDELEPAFDLCPMCEASTPQALLELQTDPDVTLRRCRRCRAVAASRLPTEPALDRYYSIYYDQNQDSLVTTDDPMRLARRIASYVPARATLSVLDLGGGDGSISAAVLEQLEASGSIVVVDYDHRRRVQTSPGVTLSHLKQLEDVGDRTFDLVLASAVLEHIPRPAPVLRQLLQMVSTGGTFYARTPYVVPLMIAARRARVSIDFTFPGHLYDLGSDFWTSIGSWLPEFNRFEVLSSRPSPVETGFRAHPTRTLVAAAMKWPWTLVGDRWRWVGGWEIAARRGG